MTLAWLIAQLVFWCALMAAIVATAVAAILVPPYLVYRLIQHRIAEPPHTLSP